MRAPRILTRYLVREVSLFSALGLAALIPLLVSRNLFQVLEEKGIVADLTWGDLGLLLRCTAAMLLPYALPIAFLLGVLLAVGRMSADRETLALRSCGLGLRSLLVPVLALGLCVSGLTAFLMLHVEHRAQRALRARVVEVATRGAMIEAGSFRELDGRTLFFREHGKDGGLQGVVIADDRSPRLSLRIFAERGRLSPDPERGEIALSLERGDIHLRRRDALAAPARISFERATSSLPAGALRDIERRRLRPREMPMRQLLEILERAGRGESLAAYRKQNPEEYRVQLHRRVALPLAPLVFPLVAVPVGLRVRRNARAWAGLLCALLVGGYYALLVFGQLLALEGSLPAALAVWAPNGTFAAVGLGLLLAARRAGHGA